MKLGIYIQVPFCQTKCTYCNFHTGVFAKSLWAPYVDAVLKEIREIANPQGLKPTDLAAGLARMKPCPDGTVVDTVYVGGGTPSLLEPGELSRMLAAVRETFACAWEELTLEADPETITAEKAAAWRAAGFNRISLGAQSFNDVELKAAGRMHRRTDTFAANRTLREAGFTNISFDLIAGLPHQTRETWEASLEELLGLAPEHVSVYLMEIDEGSRLGREVIQLGSRYSAPALPGEEQMAEFYERACQRLASAGYEHYEISNWGRKSQGLNTEDAEVQSRAEKGNRSKHNLKYWRREAYLGFGAGAHSFDGARRWANVHDPAAYVAAMQQGRSTVEQMEQLTSQQALDEELFLGLRQLGGLDMGRIERQYNVTLTPRLAPLRDAGLIEMDGALVRLAPARLAVSNEVFVELMG